MRIAISTDGNNVSAHFGRCPSFTIVDIDAGKVTARETLDNPGHEPGFLPKFLAERGVTRIVAGGMGQRAIILFSEQGIDHFLGVHGNIDSVIERLAEGTLEGGESLCSPGAGKGYGLDKTECDHGEEGHDH